MLIARPALFLATQAIFALGFFLAGSPLAWEEGANWWLITVALADLACFFLLVRIFKAEGNSYWDIFRIDRKTIKGDLLALVIMTALVAPFATLPNIWLGQAFFGNPEATLELIVRPLPLWAVYLAIFSFSIAQGFTELPTYFGYCMPRLEFQGLNRWLAIFIPGLMLGLQHIAAPLLFDVRFIAWRGLMFIPFALVTGFAIYWRPRVLPYFIVVHILMNMSFATMFLSMAY
jgi:hypothetical protein